MAELKLFRTRTSPFALRVVWALKLKDMEFETVMEDFPNKSDLLLQYNPIHKKVPVFVHHGKPICESLVILEYIDETWKQTPLLPQDPLERATARFWARFNDEKLLPSIFQGAMKQGKEKEEASVQITENLTYVETLLKGKKFFGGETIGILDLVLGWMANIPDVMEEITGETFLKEEEFPLLSKWVQVFSSVPVIKENLPPREILIAKFKTMQKAAQAAAASK